MRLAIFYGYEGLAEGFYREMSKCTHMVTTFHFAEQLGKANVAQLARDYILDEVETHDNVTLFMPETFMHIIELDQFIECLNAAASEMAHVFIFTNSPDICGNYKDYMVELCASESLRLVNFDGHRLPFLISELESDHDRALRIYGSDVNTLRVYQKK